MTRARDLADGESRFVNTAGDTMSGNLAVNGSLNASSTFQHLSATKNYLPYAVETGSVTMALSAQSSNGPYQINFTNGRFSAVPSLNLTQASLAGGTGAFIGKYTSLSTTSAQCYVYNGPGTAGTGSANFSWLAVQD